MAIALLILAFLVLFVLFLKIIGTLLGLVFFLVVAALCGAAAEYFLGHREGVGETFLIGLIGAAIGAVLAHVLHLPGLIHIGGVSIVWTVVGAMIVVFLLKLAGGERSTVRRIR
jgi:uncharacterized membrane protein YeaQ/YmgE (transglycosylase-associated protein family)